MNTPTHQGRWARTHRRAALRLLLATAALCAAGGAVAQGPTIVVSTLEDKDPVTDMAERVMSEAYRRLGITLEVRELPGERALQSANTGQVDGELYRKGDIAEIYTRLIKIPVVISSADFVAFTRDKNLPITDWNSLVPYSVGYKRGVKGIELNVVKGTRAEPVASTDQAFHKLANGRNDVVVSPRITGLALVSQLGIKRVTVIDPPLLSVPLYHYLHVKNKELVPQLTATLQQMEKEGVIKQLHRQVEQAAASQAK